MVMLEITENEDGALRTYYVRDTANHSGFITAKLKGGAGVPTYLLYYCRAKIAAGQTKLEDYELLVYKQVLDNIPDGVDRVCFKIYNLTLDKEYYATVAEIRKAPLEWAGEKYRLRLGDLASRKPDETPGLLMTKQRLEIQKKNKDRIEGIKHNEGLKFRDTALYQFPLSNDPRKKGDDKEVS